MKEWMEAFQSEIEQYNYAPSSKYYSNVIPSGIRLIVVKQTG